MNLKSYHAEGAFYKSDLVEKLRGIKAPQVFFNTDDVFNNRFGMIQQDLSMFEDGQPYGFGLKDAELSLKCLAAFHASNWGRPKPDRNFVGWDVAAYWTEDTECKKEKVGEKWPFAVANFPDLLMQDLYGDLGGRILAKLSWLRHQLRNSMAVPYPDSDTQSGRTMCHGDYKISNMFVNRLKSQIQSRSTSRLSLGISRTSSEKAIDERKSRDTKKTASATTDLLTKNSEKGTDIYAIDWQWFGYGNCCIDVVSFINSSLHEEILSSTDFLLKVYYDALVDNGVKNYSWQTFMNHYKLHLVDFCTFCIVGKWSKMTPEEVEQYAKKVKDGLHLRSFPHMAHIMEQANKFMKYFETTTSF